MSLGLRPILIIFEGVDKSGKTTILNEFNKKTNFSYVVLDRLTTSSKVYNELFERDRLKYYEDVERKLLESFNVLVVLCECDTELNKKRLKKANETLPKQLENVDMMKRKFYDEVEKSFINFMLVDTTFKNIDECVEDVIKRVKGMEEDNG